MPQRFEYPLKPSPRLAVYDTAEAFPSPPLPSVETAALPACTLPLALLWDWQPVFPVIVFTGEFWGSLSEADRDRIWQAWEVPVYEFRLDSAGCVVAEECDAHDGLHLRGEAKAPAGLDWSRCPCGQDTPRIPSLCPAEVTAAAAAA